MSVDITQLTAHLTPEQQETVKKTYKAQAEHPTAAFLYCFFLGIFGAHRFYLRQWRQGWLHLILPVLIVVALVAGVVSNSNPLLIAAVIIAIVLLLIALIWEIIDLFRIDQEVYARNLKLAERIISATLFADPSVEQAAIGRMDMMVHDAETRSIGAQHHEQIATETAAAAAAPAIIATAADIESGVPGSSADTSAIASEQTTDRGVGYAAESYSATTLTQISANPNETEQKDQAPSSPQSWSDTQTTQLDEIQSQGDEQHGAETLADVGGAGVAAAAVGLGVAGGLAFSESLTRAHSETDHSVTDSVEQIDTIGESQATQANEAVAAEAVAEPQVDSNAATWPDHPVVAFDDAPPSESDDSIILAPQTDYTDMGALADETSPIADVATAGAIPLLITLPTTISASTAHLSANGEALALPQAPETITPDKPATTDAGIEALNWGHEGMVAPPEYIPPTVPIVTVADSQPDDNVVPVVTEAVPDTDLFPAAEPEHEPQPELGAEAMPVERNGETLAALAGIAGTAGVLGAAAVIHHEQHAEAQPENDSSDTLPSMKAVQPEQPVQSEEPEQPNDATVAASGIAAEDSADQAAGQSHGQLRRIRVTREFKVNGDVVEVTSAEELIPIDADPEPVRARLQAYLHQQSEARERQMNSDQ